MANKKQTTPFYFGGMASCTAAIIVHPLDLTKVRLQNAKGNQNVGMLGTVKNIIRTEGPLKLYAGLSASILRQATYSTARLGGYEKLKQLLLQKEKSKQICIWKFINDLTEKHIQIHLLFNYSCALLLLELLEAYVVILAMSLMFECKMMVSFQLILKETICMPWMVY